MVAKMTFQLCEVGWRLYDEWSELENAKDKPAANQAKRLYYQHRAQCPDCEKPMEEHERTS